jgi:hypothetical protein
VALFGVEVYASAAYVSLNTMALETRDALEEVTGDVLCASIDQEIEQALRSWRFVASALELMAARPRPPGGVWVGGEISLLSEVKQMVERGSLPPAHPVHGRVLPAWRKLMRLRELSGGGRGFLTHLGNVRRESDESNRAKVEALAATSALRVCAAAQCAAREVHPAQFKLCAACKTVCYCSKAHQAEDWPAHKGACKAARKAAAAAEQAGGASR